MKNQGAIVERIRDAIKAVESGEYENACFNVFSAINATASLRKPKLGDRKKMISWLRYNLPLIYYLATGSLIAGRPFTVNGRDTADMLYELVRCSLFHEGKFSEKVQFSNENNLLQIGTPMIFPENMLRSLILCCSLSPENSLQKSEGLNITISGKLYNLDDLWGERKQLIDRLNQIFSSANLS